MTVFQLDFILLAFAYVALLTVCDCFRRTEPRQFDQIDDSMNYSVDTSIWIFAADLIPSIPTLLHHRQTQSVDHQIEGDTMNSGGIEHVQSQDTNPKGE